MRPGFCADGAKTKIETDQGTPMGLAGGELRTSRLVLARWARKNQVRRWRRALAALLIAIPLLWGSSRIPVPGYARLELTDAESGRSILSPACCAKATPSS